MNPLTFFLRTPAAASAPSPSHLSPASPVGEPPPFIVHRELFGLGMGGDVLIVGICLYSLYLSVADDHAALFVVVIQAAVAFSELGRAPLAYLARTHSNAAWRSGCAAGVVVLGFITAFNLFLPLNQGMRERIATAQETAAALEEAEAIPAKLREEVARKRDDYTKAETRVKEANTALTSLPAQHCWKERCKNDPRIAASRNELSAATKGVADTKTKLDDAEKRLQEAEGPKGSSALRKKQDDHRHAVSKNMVYGAVATILGIDPAKISPSGMSWALRLMTITVCVAAGLLGSLICLASVERLPRPKASTPGTPQGPPLLVPAASIVTMARALNQTDRQFRAAGVAVPLVEAPEEDTPRAPPSAPDVADFERMTENSSLTRKPAKPRKSSRGRQKAPPRAGRALTIVESAPDASRANVLTFPGEKDSSHE